MRRTLLFLSFFLPQLTFAQCYELSPIPYSPYPYNEGTSADLNSDDTHSELIEMPFSFCFFGDTVNQLVISSNGYITFHDSLAGSGSSWSINDTVPNASNSNIPSFAILAPWQDLNPGVSGGIYHNTYGNAPFRKFVISYYEVSMFSCTALEFSNQIVLHESSNIIDINIKEKPICSSWNSGNAVEGIVNQDGSEAFIVPGRNFPEEWEVYDDAYRFKPLCGCPSTDPPVPFLVHGKVYNDLNSDCEFGVDEPTIPNVRLNVLPNDIDLWTNFNGEYALLLDSGNYYVTQSLLNPSFLEYTCTGNYIPFALSQSTPSVEVLLGDEATPSTDVSISIGSTGLVPCQASAQTIMVCNNGSTEALGLDVMLNISNPLVEYNIDSLSGFEWINDSLLIMTIDTLPPLACLSYQLFGITTCDSSLVGDYSCFDAQVELANNESIVENNAFHVCENISLQIPQLDKRVRSIAEENRWITQEYIEADDELIYMIRYANTGSVSIANVTIVDTLSPFLDHSFIEPIASSHDFYMSYHNGVVTFNFMEANLSSQDTDFVGSQLYLVYRLHQLPGNAVGTVIENQAQIYLDLPYGQSTGTTRNEIRDFSGINELRPDLISVFPNPTTGEVFLSNGSPRNTILSVQVFDTQGRMLLSKNENGIAKLDLSELVGGIYLLSIETEKGTQVSRVIRN